MRDEQKDVLDNLDNDDWESREQEWLENGCGEIIDDYVECPYPETLGWDAAEGCYYGP